jgi:hypothetical protein
MTDISTVGFSRTDGPNQSRRQFIADSFKAVSAGTLATQFPKDVFAGSNEEVGRDLAVVKRPDIKETDHEAYSKDPRFADYEAYVRSRVEQILPKDIPNRDKVLNIFANGTVDKVFNDPNSMKSDEYSQYVSKIYQNARNSFGDGYKQFGSFVTTMATVQGGRNIPPQYTKPSNQAIFNLNQATALLMHNNYNDSFDAIGYAAGGVTNGGRTAEQVSELSERILEKYIGKRVASAVTSGSADIASVLKK